MLADKTIPAKAPIHPCPLPRSLRRVLQPAPVPRRERRSLDFRGKRDYLLARALREERT